MNTRAMANSTMEKFSTLANRVFSAWTSYATIVQNNEVREMHKFYNLRELFRPASIQKRRMNGSERTVCSTSSIRPIWKVRIWKNGWPKY
jgi:hypothetical protein